MERLLLARGCRNVVLQQVGSYVGYTGRDANSFGKAARDPKQNRDRPRISPPPVVLRC